MAYHVPMRTPSAARCPASTFAALAWVWTAALVLAAGLAGTPALAGADSVAPVTALSPDQRPTLVIVASPVALLIVHHPQPLSPQDAEQLALRIGIFAAAPIIRRQARAGLDPLPQAWQSGDPDRGFVASLEAALDRSQANWPWRALKIVESQAEANDAVADLTGQDVAVVTFRCDLEDWMHTVQFSARARVKLLRAAGTPQESRTQFSIQHLSVPLTADWGRARQYAAVFRPGGPLDRTVTAAALDLSRALAVTIARLTTGTPDIRIAGREFSQLVEKPKCPECRPDDPVLHEEPGRVWVAPSKLAGTVLSLPVGPTDDQAASERPRAARGS